jgi:hypothetical protein
MFVPVFCQLPSAIELDFSRIDMFYGNTSGLEMTEEITRATKIAGDGGGSEVIFLQLLLKFLNGGMRQLGRRPYSTSFSEQHVNGRSEATPPVHKPCGKSVVSSLIAPEFFIDKA